MTSFASSANGTHFSCIHKSCILSPLYCTIFLCVVCGLLTHSLSFLLFKWSKSLRREEIIWKKDLGLLLKFLLYLCGFSSHLFLLFISTSFCCCCLVNKNPWAIFCLSRWGERESEGDDNDVWPRLCAGEEWIKDITSSFVVRNKSSYFILLCFRFPFSFSLSLTLSILCRRFY